MANKMDAPLVVKDLCKNYPAFQLKPLSFELEAGRITGFIGRNGAGKTTTINAVLSLIHPDGGEVTFCGLDRQAHGIREPDRQTRRSQPVRRVPGTPEPARQRIRN